MPRDAQPAEDQRIALTKAVDVAVRVLSRQARAKG